MSQRANRTPSQQGRPPLATDYQRLLTLAAQLTSCSFSPALLPVDSFHPPPSSVAQPLLTELNGIITRLIQTNNESNEIGTLQGLLRTSLVRHRYTRSVTTYRDQRALVDPLKELFKAEMLFVTKLRSLVYTFMMPLKTTDRGIIHPNEAKMIFGNVSELAEVHEEMLARLSGLMDKWPSVAGVGATLLSMGPKLKIYGEYVRNVPAAVDTCLRLEKTNPKFQQWLSTKANELKGSLFGVQLVDLIPCPLNQINEYDSRLQKMTAAACSIGKATKDDDDSLGLSGLEKASALMKELSEVVQISFEMSHNRLKVLHITQALGSPKSLLPADDTRRYVGEWNLSIVGKKGSKKVSQRRLYLFSDCAMFCKPTTKSSSASTAINSSVGVDELTSNSLKPKECVKLDESDIKLEEAGDKDVNLSSPHFFYTVKLASTPAKEHFVKQLSKLLNQNQNETQVFGRDLSSLLQKEGKVTGVPTIVEVLTGVLETPEMLETEGLFRISGDLVEIKQLRDLFDTGAVKPGNCSVLTPYSTHSIAAVLKAFFRELPEPAIPFSLYEPLLAFPIVGNESEDDEGLAAKVGWLFKDVPLTHMTLLRHLMAFLRAVASKSDQNLMNVRNLAIVFAPNILRPKLETVESTLNLPRAIDAVALLITLSAKMWPSGASLALPVKPPASPAIPPRNRSGAFIPPPAHQSPQQSSLKR